MKIKDIYIIGVGNNTPVYIDLIQSIGIPIAGLIHYNSERNGEEIYGIPIISSTEGLFRKGDLKGMNFAVSVGDNNIRAKLSQKIRKKGGQIPTLIHPSAVVSKYAKLAQGVTVHANSVVQAGAEILEDTVISYNSSVTHGSKIGRACYMAAGSNVGAYVTIFDEVLIGQSAIIISGKVNFIGRNSIIGAGAVVTKDVEENSILLGNPARVIERIR